MFRGQPGWRHVSNELYWWNHLEQPVSKNLNSDKQLYFLYMWLKMPQYCVQLLALLWFNVQHHHSIPDKISEQFPRTVLISTLAPAAMLLREVQDLQRGSTVVPSQAEWQGPTAAAQNPRRGQVGQWNEVSLVSVNMPYLAVCKLPAHASMWLV